MTTRLAVLGSPIAHSKSPLLHAAAYDVLGLDWQYEAIEVTGATLHDFMTSRDETWRGLSLTMPLKRDVLPLLTDFDETVSLTGSANTVLFDNGTVGFNTDVYGIIEALRAAGVTSVTRVQILGGGATAASAMAAVGEMGARSVDVALRNPLRIGNLDSLSIDLGVDLTVRTLDAAEAFVPDLVISTLPGHSEHLARFSTETRTRAVLFDVAYDPWPSALASTWLGTVISGLEMLTLQALAQVRIFVNGSPHAVLDNEHAVLAAMKRAVAT